MEPSENTLRQQFVEDYLLVTDNDFTAYTKHMQLARNAGGDVYGLGLKIQEMFNDSIAGAVAQQKAKGNAYASDLIGQMLLGWGVNVFEDIARHYIDTDLENRLVNHLTSVLKTEQGVK
jgi:hypothetical protein